MTEWLQIKKDNSYCIVYLESGDIDVDLTLQNININTTSKKLDTNIEHTDIYHEISILKNSIDVIANIINTSFFEAMRKQNIQVLSLNSHLQDIAHKVENLERVKFNQDSKEKSIDSVKTDFLNTKSIQHVHAQNHDEESATYQGSIEQTNSEIELSEPTEFTSDNPPEPFFIGRIETKKKLFGIFPL